MALKNDIATDVSQILAQEWNVRDGEVVPTTEAVALAGGGVKLTATMLYADLADSTQLVMTQDRRVGAKIFKAYLIACARTIRSLGGEIRSFDGDRIMAVFLGGSKNTSAAKCALKINWVFQNVVKFKLEARYPALAQAGHQLQQCVGIDTSEILVVRAGVRNSNDLVWVGRAANVAAKLSTLRDAPYFSWATKAVFDSMRTEAKMTVDGKAVWEPRHWAALKGAEQVYRSSFWCEP